MSNIPNVSETVLKGKKAQIRRYHEKKAKESSKQSEKKKKNKNEIKFKRAEDFTKEFRNIEHDKVRAKRVAKKKDLNALIDDDEDAKVAFVIRIKGETKISPKSKKILNLLRLKEVNNGIFIRLSKPIVKMLKIVEPYIVYGYPNLKTIREMIYKRGFAKVNGQRVPITDNKIIENELGSIGIVCIEDLVHEIHTCGPHFKDVSRFLWPFRLSNPKGSLIEKLNNLIEKSEKANREDEINRIVEIMN